MSLTFHDRNLIHGYYTPNACAFWQYYESNTLKCPVIIEELALHDVRSESLFYNLIQIGQKFTVFFSFIEWEISGTTLKRKILSASINL